MLKCIVIDRDSTTIKILEKYIEQLHNVVIAGVCEDVISTENHISQFDIDIIFLDLNIIPLTNKDFINLSNSTRPKVVIGMGEQSAAIRGFEIGAIDFLAKPVSFEARIRAILKAQRIIHNEVAHSIKPQSLFVKAGYKIIRVDLDDLIFMEALKDHSLIHLNNGESIRTLDSLSSLVKRLPRENFIQVHRSFIVCLNKINRIEKSHVFINKHRVPVGPLFYKDFMSKIKTY